jgi:hypothetical protein
MDMMKRIEHGKASHITGGSNMVCGNAQYFWVRDDSSSGYVCLKREECTIPDDKYGNSPIVFNRVASSFCGR